jgi:hypothetical protein
MVMNKLALLLLLALPACVSQEKLTQERADKNQARVDALSQIESACAEDQVLPGTVKYRNCLQSQANKEGYRVLVADNGQASLQPTNPVGVSARYEPSGAHGVSTPAPVPAPGMAH